MTAIQRAMNELTRGDALMTAIQRAMNELTFRPLKFGDPCQIEARRTLEKINLIENYLPDYSEGEPLNAGDVLKDFHGYVRVDLLKESEVNALAEWFQWIACEEFIP